MYSSLICSRIYKFLLENNCIESKIQKIFWSDISGVIEHTELLSYIINHARKKQRQAIITLLDLQNAFGEVDHRLLLKVLDYHHVPVELKSLIKDYYHSYALSIGTGNYSTELILVRKGVLQGDCLSPFLFNMVINTLIKTIDDEKVKCMGYKYWDIMSPRHWFQFADDSALVRSKEEDSQLSLNIFTKWCTWASLIIKVSKCKTFGIKKYGSKSIQFKPYLRTNNELIPPVKINQCFVNLGKEYSFDMKPDKIKKTLLKDLNQYVEVIDRLPLHPKNKIMIVSHYVYSKLRWNLSIYEVSETWTIQNLDSIVKTYVKRWLHLHQGANFRHLYLPIKRFGMRLSLPSDIYRFCQLSKQNTLKKSLNDEIKELYKLTVQKHHSEERLLEIETTQKPKDRLNKEIIEVLLKISQT